MSRPGARRAWPAPLCLAAASAVWCALLLAPPLLVSAGHAGAARLTRAAFSPLCHQIASRSFRIDGTALGVCARCTGVYAGFLAGCIVIAARCARPRRDGRALLQAPGRAPLLIAALPSALEVAAEWTGLSQSPAARALAGSALGFVIALYAAPAAAELPAAVAGEIRRLIPASGRTHAKAR